MLLMTLSCDRLPNVLLCFCKQPRLKPEPDVDAPCTENFVDTHELSNLPAIAEGSQSVWSGTSSIHSSRTPQDHATNWQGYSHISTPSSLSICDAATLSCNLLSNMFHCGALPAAYLLKSCEISYRRQKQSSRISHNRGIIHHPCNVRHNVDCDMNFNCKPRLSSNRRVSTASELTAFRFR